MRGELQPAFVLPYTELVESRELESPAGLVYSTNPVYGRCSDGNHFVLKGTVDREIVKAEAAAHAIADLVSIPTPEWKFVSAPSLADHLLFGSEMIVDCFRDVSPWIKRNSIADPDVLPLIVAFDIWIANPDRNLGNLIGRQSADTADARVQIVAIDFEKAKSLSGPTPAIESGSLKPTDCGPQGELATLLAGLRRPTDSWIESVALLEEQHIVDLLDPIAQTLEIDPDWPQSTAHLLIGRARKLPEMIAEVWQ